MANIAQGRKWQTTIPPNGKNAMMTHNSLLRRNIQRLTSGLAVVYVVMRVDAALPAMFPGLNL
jgi:hypothetical protein